MNLLEQRNKMFASKEWKYLIKPFMFGYTIIVFTVAIAFTSPNLQNTMSEASKVLFSINYGFASGFLFFLIFVYGVVPSFWKEELLKEIERLEK